MLHYCPTLRFQSFDQFLQTLIVLVDVRSKHGPIDARNDVLDAARAFARRQVDVLVENGKNRFSVRIRRVQFALAEARFDVLSRDYGDQSEAIVKAVADCLVPIRSGGYVLLIEPHVDVVSF